MEEDEEEWIGTVEAVTEDSTVEEIGQTEETEQAWTETGIARIEFLDLYANISIQKAAT